MAAAVESLATPHAVVRCMPFIKSAATIAVAIPLATGSRSHLIAAARCATLVHHTATHLMVTVMATHMVADQAVIILCVVADFTSHLVDDDA
jgi:hypothetical protein